MGRFERGAAAAFVFLNSISPVLAGDAASLLVAQAGTSGGSATSTAAPAAGVAQGQSAPPAAPTPNAVQGATESATAKKSAVSAPACYVRFLEAKVAGKLQGRTYVDFRRDVCGEKETTAVFPTAISSKYAGEKDLDKARRQTCADQFTANKTTNGNGGLKWIEKDGGYYAECVNRLKG
jgi:hypothetical protein